MTTKKLPMCHDVWNIIIGFLPLHELFGIFHANKESRSLVLRHIGLEATPATCEATPPATCGATNINRDICQCLFSKRIPPGEKLVWASVNRQTRIAELLLPSVVSHDSEKLSQSLWCASYSGNLQMVKLLLKYKAHISIGSENIIVLTCIPGYFDIAELLMKYAMDINTQGNDILRSMYNLRPTDYAMNRIRRMMATYSNKK